MCDDCDCDIMECGEFCTACLTIFGGCFVLLASVGGNSTKRKQEQIEEKTKIEQP